MLSAFKFLLTQLQEKEKVRPCYQQTIVLKVHKSGEKHRTKAMKIVVETKGVTGVRLEKEQGKLTVEGEGVDVYALARTLKKKVGKTDIIKIS